VAATAVVGVVVATAAADMEAATTKARELL
jgi:hypothetical protein